MHKSRHCFLAVSKKWLENNFTDQKYIFVKNVTERIPNLLEHPIWYLRWSLLLLDSWLFNSTKQISSSMSWWTAKCWWCLEFNRPLCPPDDSLSPFSLSLHDDAWRELKFLQEQRRQASALWLQSKTFYEKCIEGYCIRVATARKLDSVISFSL